MKIPKLIINTPERRQWRYSGIVIVNIEEISNIAVVFPVDLEKLNDDRIVRHDFFNWCWEQNQINAIG